MGLSISNGEVEGLIDAKLKGYSLWFELNRGPGSRAFGYGLAPVGIVNYNVSDLERSKELDESLLVIQIYINGNPSIENIGNLVVLF